jgi:hypothetical protein
VTAFGNAPGEEPYVLHPDGKIRPIFADTGAPRPCSTASTIGAKKALNCSFDKGRAVDRPHHAIRCMETKRPGRGGPIRVKSFFRGQNLWGFTPRRHPSHAIQGSIWGIRS